MVSLMQKEGKTDNKNTLIMFSIGDFSAPSESWTYIFWLFQYCLSSCKPEITEISQQLFLKLETENGNALACKICCKIVWPFQTSFRGIFYSTTLYWNFSHYSIIFLLLVFVIFMYFCLYVTEAVWMLRTNTEYLTTFAVASWTTSKVNFRILKSFY